MSEVRKLPAVDKRVETGAVQFGDDWPGYFIRGDDAMGFVISIEEIQRALKDNDNVSIVLSRLVSLKNDILANTIIQPKE